MKNITEIILKKIHSPGGSLSFFEKSKEINFDIKRVYYIYDFCQENRRGFHAHKELKQVLWCPAGIIEIDFTDGKIWRKYILDDPTKILVVNEGYWREFVSLKKNSILCVGASEIYSEDDYIRDYNEYLEFVERD
ncbi:MAG: FdtA/QdtA family cupin domain-containing protein [Cetobacterium sp.]